MILNENGKEFGQFAGLSDLKVANTYFKKRDIKKYTWTKQEGAV